MEGTCFHCGSGTSLLEYVEDEHGQIKVCPDCMEEYYDD